MRRRDFTAAALAFAATPAALGADDAGTPGRQWQHASGAASRWSADALRAIDAEARALRADAVMVVHRGAVAYAHGEIAKPMPLYSVRKSIASLLIGMQRARGRVDLQATLASLGIDDRDGLSDAEKSATVQQLLQSRSGVYHRAAYETAAMARERPARGSHAPGTHWYYNNWDFNALGTIFERCAGTTLLDALAVDLAAPLGFEDFDAARHTRWHRESASVHAAYLIELSARDLARIGVLTARGGEWQGRTLLPAAWIAESTRAWSLLPGRWQAYGYMWWVPQRAWPFWRRAPGDVFYAHGNHGQYLFVDRARDLVVVHRIQGPLLLRSAPSPEALSPLLERIVAAVPT